MFKKVEKENERLIEDYIGDDYNKCLYLYLDLMKYGVTNENVKSWLDFKDDEITSVVLKYYSGMHIFSKNKNCDYDNIINLIAEENPSIICAEKFLIENLFKLLDNEEYNATYGSVRAIVTFIILIQSSDASISCIIFFIIQ